VTDLKPADSVALFDSATAMVAALAAALRGEGFPNLGSPSIYGRAVRAVGHLPWPVLRRIYTRIGAAEGIDPARLGDVDLGAVARWLAGQYPRRRYPAAFIGSSNGALTHLAAAIGAPWLPGTVLVPVGRVGDPERPVDAMRFGEQHAPALLQRNPDVVLHHMHDQEQDHLMVARMTYFRTKWVGLPAAYPEFLDAALLPGAPVIIVDDRSSWPVVRIGERHVFQPGAQGGLDPEDYLSRPHTPTADDHAPEAEWGAEPAFNAAVADWCRQAGRRVVVITTPGPQEPAHPVAVVMREWYHGRGEPDDQLLVPSFILGDPWLTINTGHVPFWGFFSVQPARRALEDHLARSDRYTVVRLLLFQHGSDSQGIARPEDWARTVERFGARADFLGLDTDKFPHDIGFLGRYGPALKRLPHVRALWSALDVDEALRGLAQAGLEVSDTPAGSM
jgi:hypothetical protein